jgi:hypothetical protein
MLRLNSQEVSLLLDAAVAWPWAFLKRAFFSIYLILHIYQIVVAGHPPP